MRDLTKMLAICSVLAVLLFATSALAVGTSTHRFGVQEGAVWTFTTDIDFVGYCNEAHTCKEYYWGAPLGWFNSHDGVHGQVKTDSNYNYWNMWYSKNDGATWHTALDEEYRTYYDEHYYCHGYEWTAYNNWQAPGNCEKASFMKIRYRYGPAGTIYERRFQVPSYNCII